MSGLMMFQVVAIPLLCVAAARDVATRLIPDAIPLGLLAAGLLSRLIEGWTAAGLSLLVAAAAFACLLPIAARGWLGGGDVKLIAGLAAGLPPAATWSFIVATVFAGGVLGVAYLLARHLVPPPRLAAGATCVRRIMAVEAWRVRRRGPLPYAVAIAVGGILVLSSLPRA